MKKFRNTYRIPSARLPGWDYRNAGAYFITICTQNREHYFGECANGKIKLSTAGMIVQGCWYQIPYLSPNANLGAFVVMPNHVHGVLILDDMENDGNASFDVETFDSNVSTSNVKTPNDHTPNQSPIANRDIKQNDKSNSVEVTNPINYKNSFYQNISPKSGSVSRIIQQYKTVCTKNIRLACPELDFKWQMRFYDHIIRNQKVFENISNYIINNPKQWKEDKFFKY